MSETNLRNALRAHLNGMTDVPPVDWENVGLDLSAQSNGPIKYYSTSFVTAEDISVGMELAGSDVLAGLFQINVNVPKNAGGLAITSEIDKLKAHFPRGLVLTEAGTRIVIHKVFASPALTNETHAIIPVSVRYRGI